MLGRFRRSSKVSHNALAVVTGAGSGIGAAFAVELAMRLFLALGLLQRGDLAFGQHQAFLGDLGFEGLESLLHRLQIMALPYSAHPGRRN